MKTLLTSEEKQEKMIEINKRLQSAEAKKARALLSMAMSHYEAFKLVRENEERKLDGKPGNMLNGFHARKSHK